MENFDFFQWLLIGLPVAFALGWTASRFDLRQWKRADRAAPKAYFKGLNLLLNEQPDKAIDAFIEAVQADPDTSELHFALGNLFRRRGEFERAVRVHEHLLQRADLATADRQRAQHALAQDYMKAGLFDRAEEAFRALEGTPFDTEARLARLGLYERSRDWRGAAEVAVQLEKSGTGSFATRIAHYQCELAIEADDRGDSAAADTALAKAHEAAPHAPRPLLLRAQRLARQGRTDDAMAAWAELRQRAPESFARLAHEFAAFAQSAGQTEAALQVLKQLYERLPGIDLLRALATLEGTPAGAAPQLLELLRSQPSLSAALELLDTPRATWPEFARQSVRDAVARAARPLQRYRCAACGFEAQRHFWQCPGCLSWDSFPPQRIEEL
ncbi:lipopolysaccharide assembly protein LapB [Aquabacterium humicola]|uniref:lipopolysaccharide assembly protein LapB n=1 Tax=Aquabacterium humicola TaxID=3237377 RepID=UPI0025431FC7|nr:lipopolysaccharide assembly protein LapB [Rubrivivax pictus]